MRLQIGFLIILVLHSTLGIAQQPGAPAQAAQAPAAQPPAGQVAPAQAPATAPQVAAPQVPPSPSSGNLVLNLPGASLTEVIDQLARVLKINYIIDPRVKGNVTIHTYGEIKATDVKALLDTILRINNAAMVQVGDIYRIIPI